jgi:hypothetical protein
MRSVAVTESFLVEIVHRVELRHLIQLFRDRVAAGDAEAVRHTALEAKLG